MSSSLFTMRITLREVLVVLGVACLLLMLVGVDVAPQGLLVTYRARDTALCVSIKTAIVEYQSDYGELPFPPGAFQKNGVVYAGAEPGKTPTQLLPGTIVMFRALMGNVDGHTGLAVNTGLNTRNTPYLTKAPSQLDFNGVPIQSFRVGGLPAYPSIAMDSTNSSKLNGIPDFEKGDFTGELDEGIAVWCCNDQSYDKPNRRWSHSW